MVRDYHNVCVKENYLQLESLTKLVQRKRYSRLFPKCVYFRYETGKCLGVFKRKKEKERKEKRKEKKIGRKRREEEMSDGNAFPLFSFAFLGLLFSEKPLAKSLFKRER